MESVRRDVAAPPRRRLILLQAALCGLLWASAGCSEECYYDTCCEGTRVCDEGRCVSVDTSVAEAGLCASLLDCAPREECVDGRCVRETEPEPVERCESDGDCDPPDTVCGPEGDCEPGCSPGGCPDGSYCGPLGRCVEGCALDEHCAPPDTVCDAEQGECVPGCTEDDCGIGEHCGETTGRCEEGCLSDAHCDPPGLICEGDECVPGCVETGCPTGMRCDIVSGRCGEGCDDDSNCAPPETICGEGGTCVPGCLDTGCGYEEYCDEELGRCMAGCLDDTHCDPPDYICEGGACHPGCLETGCGFEEHCDVVTGRCTDGCASDADCSLPDSICGDEFLCVPGCLETGCGFEEHCVAETGRCAAGCLQDSHCDPPETICDVGSCVSGCISSGCGYEEHCDQVTGHCEPGCVEHTDCDPPTSVCGDEGDCVDGCMVAGFCPEGLLCRPEDGVCEEPGPGELGDSCFDGAGSEHAMCESDFCLGFDPPFCSRPCTSTMQHCPEDGAVCFTDLSPPGAGACLEWGTVDAGPGAPCGGPADCKSRQCYAGVCTDTCQHDRDCTLPGHICTLAENEGEKLFLCAPPLGDGAMGAGCATGESCQSGVCVGSKCTMPCHTSWDCPSNMACDIIRQVSGDDSVVMRVCRVDSAGRNPGTGDVGESCNSITHQPCRSLWCHQFDIADYRCIDVCATSDDCPTGFRCSIVTVSFTSGGDATAPICVLR